MNIVKFLEKAEDLISKVGAGLFWLVYVAFLRATGHIFVYQHVPDWYVEFVAAQPIKSNCTEQMKEEISEAQAECKLRERKRQRDA